MIRCFKLKKRILSAVLAVTVMLPGILPVPVYAAGENTLTLKAAKAMAVAESDACYTIECKIASKEAALKSAIKSIALKKKNMSTFRWSPLLSFKFPEKPNESQSFDFTYKPISIQYEIDSLKHKLTDQYLAEYQKVDECFVDIVINQDKIDFDTKRLENMELTLAKNRKRWLMGEAKESDIKTMESKVEALKNSIATNTRALDAAKKKLSGLIGMDVSTGYTFENPYVSASIPRSALQTLIDSTLADDQSYYQAKNNEALALISLQTNNDLIKRFYKASDYKIIEPYVKQALNGEKVKQKTLKPAYDRFLTAIDRYWQGKKKIFLFIKIPREWMRGSLDGVRYVEDDPYVLMDAILSYVAARSESEQLKVELEQQVEENYNTYISMRNAYQNFEKQVEDAKEQLDKDEVLNRIGDMSFSEYQSSVDSYEELQLNMENALSDYSKTMYSFDRLTCGAVSKYLEGKNENLFAVGNGTSYIEDEYANGANYYIVPIVEENAFEFSINVPESTGVTVTHYELSIDGEILGGRKEVTQKVRHLMFTLDEVSNAKVLLYNGDKFICECEINPDAYSGPLDIITGYNVINPEELELGSYSTKQNDVTGMLELTIKINPGEKAALYKASIDGKYIGGDRFNDVKKPMVYLPAMAASFDDVVLEFYDGNQGLLYKAYFDTTNLMIKKEPADDGGQ